MGPAVRPRSRRSRPSLRTRPPISNSLRWRRFDMAYSNAPTDKLYGLLPAYIRERDVSEGEPLRALLRIIEQQADDIEGDIRQLYEDAFIETSEPWVIPYIGDLIGVT